MTRAEVKLSTSFLYVCPVTMDNTFAQCTIPPLKITFLHQHNIQKIPRYPCNLINATETLRDILAVTVMQAEYANHFKQSTNHSFSAQFSSPAGHEGNRHQRSRRFHLFTRPYFLISRRCGVSRPEVGNGQLNSGKNSDPRLSASSLL